MADVVTLRRSMAIRPVVAVDDDADRAPAGPVPPGASLSTARLAYLAERAVGDAFAVEELFLRGRRRGARRLAHARTVAMALVHLVAGRSQEDVAAAFKRNRTTASNHMEMNEWLNDCAEYEAFWELLSRRFELLIELASMPSLREAWLCALKGIDRALDDGDLEGEAVDQARYVSSVFWEDRIGSRKHGK